MMPRTSIPLSAERRRGRRDHRVGGRRRPAGKQDRHASDRSHGPGRTRGASSRFRHRNTPIRSRSIGQPIRKPADSGVLYAIPGSHPGSIHSSMAKEPTQRLHSRNTNVVSRTSQRLSAHAGRGRRGRATTVDVPDECPECLARWDRFARSHRGARIPRGRPHRAPPRTGRRRQPANPFPQSMLRTRRAAWGPGSA